MKRKVLYALAVLLPLSPSQSDAIYGAEKHNELPELVYVEPHIEDLKIEEEVIADFGKNGIIDNRDELIQAMIWVESRGNDSIYNESEKAIGCLQIRPIMIRELNRICKKYGYDERWVHEDAWSREKSIRMFEIWTDLHELDTNYEKAARNWNGGPRGYKKDKTVGYWAKCNKYAQENL